VRTILVAVDGSARAADVFAAGAELARMRHARVVLFRAIFIPPDFTPGPSGHPDSLPEYLKREARAQLTAFAATAPDLSCEARVEHAAQPWSAILAAAKAVDAETIVLGSHGYHGWDRVLGTTAGKVANLADHNVFVVHHPRAPSITGS
jgi:nucleotide-binding universal stress UspA family protein